MTFNLSTENVLDLLTSHSWEAGKGREILFLKNRYYVFDNDNHLLDGGIILYNDILDKIFIRNEDLKGELFVTMEDEKVHLKGVLNSKLAGKINVNTLLKKSSKELKAPYLRVANVEKHLSTTDIFKMLMCSTEIDNIYIYNFEKNLHFFSTEQSLQAYIRLSQFYFQSFDIRVLQSIGFYFSSYALHAKLYEEMFMFIMTIQLAYEKGEVSKASVEFFIHRVKERLLDAYSWKSAAISTNMINEILLYFKLDSPHLPTPQECIEQLYNKNEKVQREYAHYLYLMDDKNKAFEIEILKRLVDFYHVDFFRFRKAFYRGALLHLHNPVRNGDITTLIALIKTLGNCKSSAKDVHIFFIFLVANQEEKIEVLAKEALQKCTKGLKTTLSQLPITKHIYE